MRAFAIIPAAGRSRRMGRPKLLLPWGATTVIEHVLAEWRASRAEQVVVVVNPADERLAETCAACGAQVVVPDQAPAEMKDSVLLGLESLQARQPDPDDAWLVAPADMPGLTVTLIDRLIAAHEAGLRSAASPPPIRAVQRGPKHGHPVLFPWRFAAEVASLGPDEGLNALVLQHGVEGVEVVSEAIPEDFDTPEDYDRLRSRHGQ